MLWCSKQTKLVITLQAASVSVQKGEVRVPGYPLDLSKGLILCTINTVGHALSKTQVYMGVR